jgi:formate-dependent nitrite reductase cytochrome c552 subunit
MRNFNLLWLIALLALLIFLVGCERKVVNENKGGEESASCFTCHGDSEGRLIQAEGEWRNSVHASGAHVDYTNRSSYCPRCHSHEGFTDYLATDATHGPYASASAIHCFTCHAPHTTGTLELRTESAVTLVDGSSFDHGAGNLCANCHQSLLSASTITDSIMLTSNRWGPHHGTQADMLNGTGGYEFADYDYESSGHATDVEEACAGCHMANVQTTDGYKIGGHSFNMVDEESGSNLVKYCNTCHPDAKSYDYDNAQTTVEEKLDTLQGLLLDAGLLADSHGELLPNVPTDDTLIIADKNIAGALYNYLVIEADRSEGVHNFKYINGLLESSIEYLREHTAPDKLAATGIELIPAH